MAAFLKFSAWIACVFIVIKLIFKYLAWLYHDKDKSLRDAVQQAWDYLSQHSYFDVARAALERLYDRLAGIFQKRIRFFYLFLLFLLLNAVSMLLGTCFFDFDPTELKALISFLFELAPPDTKLITIDMLDSTIRPAMVVLSVFQLTLLDLSSFLFTVGIIWLARRSRSLIMFLIELITDISILVLFFGVIFSLLYFWLFTNFLLGIFGSFFVCLMAFFIIFASYGTFRYMGCTEIEVDYFQYWHPEYRLPNYVNAVRQDPFSLLFLILLFPFLLYPIMTIIIILSPYLRTAIFACPFPRFALVFSLPIILFWSLRIFKMRPEDKADSVLKVAIIVVYFAMLATGIWFLILYHPGFVVLYQLLLPAQNSHFVSFLVLSSALPSFAHLIAITAAIIAKSTPKRFQQFINDHLNALSKNDEKVLRQLGNAFGGLGALITAIIQLILKFS